MRSRALRSLVFACSLLFALPQGWCCIFAGYTPQAAATAASVSPGGCCEGCGHRTQSPSTPDQKPSEPPSRCPCSDRLTVLPSASAVEKADLDFAFAAVLPPLETVPPQVAVIEEALSVVHPPTHQLHLFKCVWLC